MNLVKALCVILQTLTQFSRLLGMADAHVIYSFLPIHLT